MYYMSSAHFPLMQQILYICVRLDYFVTPLRFYLDVTPLSSH